MLCYKLQSLGRKCPNSALKLKFPLSSIFDKLIAGLLISLCSFGVLPDDCAVDGFFAKRRPCLTAVSVRLLVSTSLQYAHSVPSALLLNVNLFSVACFLGICLREIAEECRQWKVFSTVSTNTHTHNNVVWFPNCGWRSSLKIHFWPRVGILIFTL